MNFYNRGQSLIGVIIVLVIVGLFAGGLYYYFSKQIPEVPEITKKPVEEEIIKLEKEVVTPPPEEELSKEEVVLEEKITEISPPPVYISSDSLKQGDTLLIKIKDKPAINEVSGKFGSTKINFFKPVTAKGWIAILGIDVRKKPGKYNLVINFSDGSKFEKELNIIKRKFPITELVVTKELKEKGFSPSKIQENVAKENLVLQEVLSIFTPEAYFDQAFIYHLEKIKDVGAFGNIRKSGQITLQRLGVDLEANIGEPVYAINDGVVRLSRNFTNYGKAIIIDHGLGIFSLYLHLDEFKVSEGKAVKRGDIIALSGNTGYSIAPHLHFSIKVNKANVDPLRFISLTKKEMIK